MYPLISVRFPVSAPPAHNFPEVLLLPGFEYSAIRMPHQAFATRLDAPLQPLVSPLRVCGLLQSKYIYVSLVPRPGPFRCLHGCHPLVPHWYLELEAQDNIWIMLYTFCSPRIHACLAGDSADS